MKTKITFTKETLWLLVFTFIFTISAKAQQVINTTLQQDGNTRQYRLYIPQSYDANNPSPLILSYHGFTNNIDIQYNQTNFQQLAEDNQFIFVTPQGIGGGWAINNFFGGSNDDLGFSDALIDKIQEDYAINEKRIYATGFSNGGYFSYRMACELSPRVAAIASIAGSMTARWIDNGQCQPQHPTAILQITGTNDGTIPISGGGLGKSIADVMEYWADYNNADSSPDVTDLGSGSTQYVWDNGDNGVEVEFISVGSKGHSWVGGNVNTSQEVWNFFSRFDIDGALDSTTPPITDVTCTGDVSNFPNIASFETNIGDWSQESSGDDLNWTRDSGGTDSAGTGPSSGAEGSNFYLYVEASGEGAGFPNKRAILNSPCLDFSALDSPTLTFQYHMVGSAIETLDVEARTNNEGNWVSIFNRTGAQGTDWNQASIDLSVVAGNGSVQLRFNAVTGDGSSGWQSDIAIDNVSIQNGTVDNPTEPGNGCVDGLTSFPYLESFEGTSFPGWSNETSNDVNWSLLSSATPSSGTGPSAAVNGDTYAYVEASTSGTGFPSKNAILNTPCFDLSGTSSATFSFEYHMLGDAVGSFTVEASDDDATTWTSIFSRSGNQGDAWLSANLNMSSYVGGSVQFRFNVVTGTSWQGDIAIDAIAMNTGNNRAAKTVVIDAPIVADFDVMLYPNPVTNDQPLTVVLENVTNNASAYQVVNMVGQVVRQGLLVTDNSINLNGLASGAYVLQIHNGASSVTKQFIIN